MDPTAVRQPMQLRWDDYRRDFQWYATPARGRDCHRLEYPPLKADSFHANLVVVPCAQAVLDQTQPGDTIYLGTEGELEFTIGQQVFLLKPMDLLAIPVGTAYSYANVGLTNAIMLGTFAAAPVSGAVSGKVEHMVWQEYRARFGWTLPLAEQWGYHRGSGPLIAPPGLRGHTVRMPMAQSTPWHHVPRDLYFMVLQGEIEFGAGGKVWTLLPYDLLLVPAGTPYRYRNNKLAETVFYSMGGKLPPGKKGVYFTEDPGWPIRTNAPTFRVELDPYGDARLVANAA